MGLFDSTLTQTTSRFAPSLFNFETSGGSRLRSAMTGPDTFKVGVSLPQDIQALRAEELGGLRNLLSSIQGERGSILNARLSPLRQQIAEQRGLLGRSLARRNVVGSLANNEMLKFNDITGRQLADQSALATQDLINAERGIYDRIGGAADRVVAQELQTLGLSQNAIAAIINSMSSSTTQTESPSTASNIGNTITGAGDFLSTLHELGWL